MRASLLAFIFSSSVLAGGWSDYVSKGVSTRPSTQSVSSLKAAPAPDPRESVIFFPETIPGVALGIPTTTIPGLFRDILDGDDGSIQELDLSKEQILYLMIHFPLEFQRIVVRWPAFAELRHAYGGSELLPLVTAIYAFAQAVRKHSFGSEAALAFFPWLIAGGLRVRAGQVSEGEWKRFFTDHARHRSESRSKEETLQVLLELNPVLQSGVVKGAVRGANSSARGNQIALERTYLEVYHALAEVGARLQSKTIQERTRQLRLSYTLGSVLTDALSFGGAPNTHRKRAEELQREARIYGISMDISPLKGLCTEALGVNHPPKS